MIDDILNDDDLSFEEQTRQFALLASGFVGALSGQMAAAARRDGKAAATAQEYYIEALDFLRKALVRPS